MSTLPAVVPTVFAGLPLICEQSPGDRTDVVGQHVAYLSEHRCKVGVVDHGTSLCVAE